MIVAGSESQVLAARVARETGRKLVRVEHESFPDGERLVRVPGVEDKEVAVVASTPTDEAYVELLQILDAVRGASRTDLVIPYMGYSRQDDEFEDGEAVSARALGSALPHVDSVTTVNLHETDVLEDWFDAPERRDLDAAPALADAFTEELEEPLVVAPDGGARKLAQSLAERVGGDADHLVKKRLSGDEVRIETQEVDAQGRDAVLVDDIVATGGTMTEAVEVLRGNGARSVRVACVHPVFARNAVLRLYSAGVERVVATDTLGTALSEASVAPVLARHL
ncbi:ribose-phosphate diphosphokinase [Haladaptatus sp. F3-133]|uniref:Ribose-phosphate pyrophosphokinase n=1 Tax=Halorutilus salinus TaxID=2487751 RepID=A0A9Q4GI00_9EURY|nr:ribose-phosphate diphosphokinase [Halorutilus salinus]MCX2818333.1 ribose-phosphate diphosphokinase [Halorutilus salinus]